MRRAGYDPPVADESDLRRIRRLVDELESDDAFERRDAIESLALTTQLRLGFDWRAGEEERKRAVRRWRRWLEDESERRRGDDVQATIQLLAHGQADPAALQKLLSGLPPAQKKALLAKLVIAKAAAEAPGSVPHAPCERCMKRPSTVRVTSLTTEGTYEQVALCEVCAGDMGG
jgi:hypothetical protein